MLLLAAPALAASATRASPSPAPPRRGRVLSAPPPDDVHVAGSNSTFGAGSYSFLDEFPHCRFAPHAQGACRSCWALAAAAALSHRLCRALGSPLALDPAPLLSAGHAVGCRAGGHEALAWRALEFVGLPAAGCNASCARYFSAYRSARAFVGEDEIRAEVRSNGPVTALFAMPDAFREYAGGVFDAPAGDAAQPHTVEIVGWGVDGAPFWLLQNSFGPEWGAGGFAKILRGANHLGIERYATAGRPRLPAQPRE
jgi:hypothetical protein